MVHDKKWSAATRTELRTKWPVIQRFLMLACLLVVWLPGCRNSSPPATPTGKSAANPQANPTPTSSPAPATPGGSTLFIPSVNGREPTPSNLSAPSPTPSPASTATPNFPVYSGPAIPRQALGVQIYLHRVDVHQLVAQLEELGVGWVKVQVSWKLYQPAPDQFSQERFTELDGLVEAAGNSGIRVLLSVAKAPEWSRPTTELDGPPGDPDQFRQFMQALAERYRGRVAAYELWNEPNLQREWNGVPLDAATLVALIGTGATGVRTADPAALVISGAPAVTGIDDGLTAIDDRRYFRAMLAAGVADVVDGFGVHPYGWANPPEATFANPDTAVPSHNNHPSFFYRDTLQDYGRLLEEFGVVNKQLWVTEFGWGSFESLAPGPPAGAEFMVYVSEWQQAVYTQKALALAQGWPWIGPLMLWNLNFAPWLGPEFSESGYSLLRADGSYRPAFWALANIPKE